MRQHCWLSLKCRRRLFFNLSVKNYCIVGIGVRDYNFVHIGRAAIAKDFSLVCGGGRYIIGVPDMDFGFLANDLKIKVAV